MILEDYTSRNGRYLEQAGAKTKPKKKQNLTFCESEG